MKTVKKKIKIRHKNWYWGNWIYNNSMMDSSIFNLQSEDFELYDEETHGWHNSEEYKNGRLLPYNTEIN